MKTVLHVAGEPNGLVQLCKRCGYPLQDYRNTSTADDGGRLGFWRAGILVDVEEGNPRVMSRFTLTDQPIPPLCTPQLPWDDWRMLGTCLHCGRYPAQGHAADCKGAAAEKERLLAQHLELTR